jgi:hypothetical protein
MFSSRLQWGKRKCIVYGEGEVLLPPPRKRGGHEEMRRLLDLMGVPPLCLIIAWNSLVM